MRRRCAWAGGDGAMVRYHDEEWGVPVHDDRRLFEFLTLESAQAGLSWATILKKREAYRRAFAGFDAARVARFSASRVRKLLGNASIVRNRAKIEATVGNARAWLRVQQEHGSVGAWIWLHVAGSPRQNAWTSRRRVPVVTDAARALSRDLKARGFKFVGPTICYAFMQATGMVNDHTTDCFRWWEVRRLARRGP